MKSQESSKTIKNNELKRRKPAQARSKQLIQDIHEATAQILEELGPGALSTNKVAKRAGVSIGSIYQYFPDKQALLDALLEERFNQLGRLVMGQLMEIMDRPYPEAAKICIKMYVEFLATQPRLTGLMLDRLTRQTPKSEKSPGLADIDAERSLQLINTYLLRHEQSLAFADLKTATYMSYNVSLLMGMRISLRPADQRENLVNEVVRMLSLYMGCAV